VRRTISAPRPDLVPAPQWEIIEALAREALKWLSAGDSDDAETLRQQLATANFIEIDYTGAGFFVRIEVATDAPKLPRNGAIGDVECVSSGDALGVLLFVANGIASELEVVSYAEWPQDITGYRCRHIRWEDQGDGVRVAAPTPQRDVRSMWS